MDVWLPAFRLPMFAKCYALKESMPFVKSKPPLPTRSLSFQIVSRVRSAISALNGGIMPIPSLQLQKKPVICREAEGLVTEMWSKELLQYSDCALSCAMKLLQASEQLSRLRF